jgi:hypothetical protein
VLRLSAAWWNLIVLEKESAWKAGLRRSYSFEPVLDFFAGVGSDRHDFFSRFRIELEEIRRE